MLHHQGHRLNSFFSAVVVGMIMMMLTRISSTVMMIITKNKKQKKDKQVLMLCNVFNGRKNKKQGVIDSNCKKKKISGKFPEKKKV